MQWRDFSCVVHSNVRDPILAEVIPQYVFGVYELTPMAAKVQNGAEGAI